MKIIGPLLLFCWLSAAQPTPLSVQTKGACSPVVTGNGNTITIKTCGMTTDQVQEWRASFRRILEKQIDPKILVALLEDIKSGQIRIENGVLRIEGKVAGLQEVERSRALDVNQQNQLASDMAQFRGQTITYDPRRDNDEVTALVNSVKAALSSVGLQLQDAGNMIMNGTPFPPPGIAIVYGPDRADIALALSRALQRVSLQNTAILDSNAQGLMRIRFGPKPR